MTPHQSPSSTSPAVRAVVRPAALVAGAALFAAPVLALAPPSSAAVNGSKAPVVVKTAMRKSVGVILVTAKGATLYELPGGTCTGGCATVWPPLVLPAGDTTPRGSKGVTGTLGTMSLSGGALQVTYNGQALYTFSGDSGHSVNGNGVGGFTVVHP